jgi:hypothetical protein
MTTTRIVQLADGEELVSVESGERARPVIDDPGRGAIERRIGSDAQLEPRRQSTRDPLAYSRSIKRLCTERPSGPHSS